MKSQVNPYLQKIASLVGERDVAHSVELFARDRRGAASSLESLADRLGVDEIREERLPFDGGLYRETDGRLVIKLNAETSSARKKFTLAHELGHLLLETIPALRSTSRSDVALERACDCIAAELLMPREEAAPFVRGLGAPSPEKLKVIASKYGVSLHVAAIRVHKDFRLWKCFIGLWERKETARTKWFVGRPRWNAAEPDTYSIELALASDRPVQTKELWQRGEFTERVWLNLLHIGNDRILGLVAFVE